MTAGLVLPTGVNLDVFAESDGWRFELRPAEIIEDADPSVSGAGSPESPVPTASASRWLVEHLADPTRSLLEPTLQVNEDFQLLRFDPPPASPPAGERPITADQTHLSVVVGEELVVKWLRRVDDVDHPALRALGHLAEVGFDGVPAPFGALTWRSPSGRDLPCAIVDRFLIGAEDGWQWCVDAVESGDRPGFPAELGRLAARLDVALGSPSSRFPLPMLAVGTAQVRRWHADARLRLDQLAEQIGQLDDVPAGPDGEVAQRRPSAVLHQHRRQLESVIDRLLEVSGRTPVQLVHGDLHVGQVLSWSGGLAVTDFDGNPGLTGSTARQPAARDVAQMLLSLDQVGRIVDRRSGFTRTAEMNAWSSTARAEFLTAYRAVLADVERPDVLDGRLLPSFLVEQACRDLLYAVRFLPRWAYATVDGLETILNDLPS